MEEEVNYGNVNLLSRINDPDVLRPRVLVGCFYKVTI